MIQSPLALVRASLIQPLFRPVEDLLPTLPVTADSLGLQEHFRPLVKNLLSNLLPGSLLPGSLIVEQRQTDRFLSLNEAFAVPPKPFFPSVSSLAEILSEVKSIFSNERRLSFDLNSHRESLPLSAGLQLAQTYHSTKFIRDGAAVTPNRRPYEKASKSTKNPQFTKSRLKNISMSSLRTHLPVAGHNQGACRETTTPT